MTTHSSCRELLLRIFSALVDGESAPFLEACAYDLTVNVHGGSPETRRWSRDGLASWCAALTGPDRHLRRLELQTVLAGPVEGVVVLREIEGDGEYRREHDRLHLCEVRDGVLTSLHVYPVSLVAAFTDDLRAATGPATAG